MNFLEAVKAMKEGKKVRRKNHIDDAYMSYVNEKFVFYGFSNTTFSLRDIEATDWEIYEEEKKNLSDKRTNASMENGWQYQEEDVKQSLKEFIEWLEQNYDNHKTPDEVLIEKAKEIFGERLI